MNAETIERRIIETINELARLLDALPDDRVAFDRVMSGVKFEKALARLAKLRHSR